MNCIQCGLTHHDKKHPFCSDACRKAHVLKLRREQENEYRLKSQALRDKRQYVAKYNRTHIENYD